MSKRLPTLAREINETLDGYRADIVLGYYSGDHKILSGRRDHFVKHVVKKGKGTSGNRLVVRCESFGTIVLDHNSAEPYQYNDAVIAWIGRVRRGLVPDAIDVEIEGLPSMNEPPQYTWRK